MTHTTTSPLLSPDARPAASALTVSRALGQLATLFTADTLDAAMDRAARAAKATVATFTAAPADCWGAGDDDAPGAAAVEFVVEFFVPPASLALFHRKLEAQLLLASPPYL